jgi:hypothetical protein
MPSAAGARIASATICAPLAYGLPQQRVRPPKRRGGSMRRSSRFLSEGELRVSADAQRLRNRSLAQYGR